MTAENQTAATGTTPVLTADLSAAAVPDLNPSAGAGTDAAAESPPEAAPAEESDCQSCGAPTREGDRFNAGYGFLCADIAACIARLSAGTQAASEPAADLEALCARLAGPRQPAPEVPRWDSLWAAFDAAERDSAIGDRKDGDLLNALEQQARAVVFPARRALVTA